MLQHVAGKVFRLEKVFQSLAATGGLYENQTLKSMGIRAHRSRSSLSRKLLGCSTHGDGFFGAADSGTNLSQLQCALGRQFDIARSSCLLEAEPQQPGTLLEVILGR